MLTLSILSDSERRRRKSGFAVFTGRELFPGLWLCNFRAFDCGCTRDPGGNL